VGIDQKIFLRLEVGIDDAVARELSGIEDDLHFDRGIMPNPNPELDE
jgi:hypothetical protein